MSLQSEGGMRFAWESLPWLPGAQRYAKLGCVPGGTGRNQEFLEEHVRVAEPLGEVERGLLFDPQTSGGLFAAVDPAAWPALRQRFESANVPCWRVGEVTAGEEIEVL
jgi:selenide,water dikinase